MCNKKILERWFVYVYCESLTEWRYVKEFVHSDFGRTVPNLGTLLNTTADILELDVEVRDLKFSFKLDIYLGISVPRVRLYV